MSQRSGFRRRDVLKGTGVAGTAVLAGCIGDGDGDGDGDGGDGGDGDGGGDHTIRLGILMGVTGGLEDLGPPIRDAAQTAVQQVQDADTTVDIESEFRDTATDENTGISEAEALVDAGYPMIAGALSSGVTIQVAENVAIQNEVVMCSPASTSPAITDLNDNDFVWRTPPTDALQGQVMAQVAMDRLDAQSTATMALNNDYGQLLSQEYVNAFEEMGGEVHREVSFEEGQSSYSDRLSEALSDDPDLLMIVGYPESGVQIFRDFYDGYSPDAYDVLVPDGLRSGELPGNVGEPMNNVWGTAPLAAGPGRDFFADQFDGDPDAAFAAQSYDAAAVLMLANAAAGENSGPAIRDEMPNVANPDGEEITPDNLAEGVDMAFDGEEINYQGASSSTNFDENGDMRAITYEIFRYQDGELQSEDEIDFEA